MRGADVIALGVAVMTPRILEGIHNFGHSISLVVDYATPNILTTLYMATPALNPAKYWLVYCYIPTISNRLWDAADSVSRGLGNASVPVQTAVAKVTGNKKALKQAQKAAAKAAKELKKQQKRGGKGWLVFGIVASAVVAAVAAWRASRPVEDPWKTPAPAQPKPAVVPSPAPTAPAESSKPAAPKPAATPMEKAKDSVDTAAEKAKEAAQGVKDAAASSATKAGEKVAEAAKHSKEASATAPKPGPANAETKADKPEK